MTGEEFMPAPDLIKEWPDIRGTSLMFHGYLNEPKTYALELVGGPEEVKTFSILIDPTEPGATARTLALGDQLHHLLAVAEANWFCAGMDSKGRVMQFVYDAGVMIGLVDESGNKFHAYDAHNTPLGSFGTKVEAIAAIPLAAPVNEREAIMGRRDKPQRSDAGKSRGGAVKRQRR